MVYTQSYVLSNYSYSYTAWLGGQGNLLGILQEI